jgi:asparagine synthase (glutamine-hydrolysing)
MRFGVENRVPFVDNHQLVEYMFNTPIAYKIRYGQSKILLRSAMGTTLPREILFRRDKKGFTGPDAKWLVANKAELLSYISPEVKDLFDVKALNKDWNRIVSRANSDGTERLWRMIFFAVWRKVYNV